MNAGALSSDTKVKSLLYHRTEELGILFVWTRIPIFFGNLLLLK